MSDVQATAERIATLIREEAERLLLIRCNWKITVNASAGGPIRLVTETFQDVQRTAHQLPAHGQ